VRTLLQELLLIQQLKDGIKWQFTIDGVKQDKVYHLYFPILFFMGDTMEHNKLCSLRGGPKATYVCRICNCPNTHLDEPCTAMTLEEKRDRKRKGERISPNTFILTDAKKIKLNRSIDPIKVVKMGYYPCMENILYDLIFCDPLGVNISTPPEALHAILLGHGTRLLNAFARLEKGEKEPRRMKDKEEEENEESEEEDEDKTEKKKRKNFVFTGKFGKLVFTEMLDVGYWLGKQSDPDKTRTYFKSGYLPKAGKGDDNTTGKKQAHEMRGVLLTILCYCLLQVHYKELSQKIGEDVLAKFVHIFEQTILMEDWLGKEKFSIEEVENARKYFPLYSNKFVETIQRKEGQGSKLAKIHFLHHFLDNIINFGRADNVFGGIGEHNMKPNVKDPARRTRFQDDQEFNILFKQYEKHLLHAGEIELDIRSALEETEVFNEKVGEKFTRLGSRIKFKVVEGVVTLKSNDVWKGCITKETFTSFLSGFGDVQGILYTEHNIDNAKYHGNPFSGWQDWCCMSINNKILPCHLLVYLHLLDAPSTPIITKYGTVSMPGHYVMVHSVAENVFHDVPKTLLYKVKYPDFLIDQNVRLVRGWGKETDLNYMSMDEIKKKKMNPKPIISLVTIESIKTPIYGLADKSNNDIPFSYMFLPPKKMWPDVFAKMMKDKVGKKKK